MGRDNLPLRLDEAGQAIYCQRGSAPPLNDLELPEVGSSVEYIPEIARERESFTFNKHEWRYEQPSNLEKIRQ